MVLSAAIPQDVISYLVQTFYLPDKTLRCCTLVSQAFLHPSRKLLFESIDLTHPYNAPSQCARLHAVFTANPALALLVKDFVVEEYEDNGTCRRPREAQWASNSSELHAILGMLTRLRSISLEFSNDRSTDWYKGVSPAFKAALGRVFMQDGLEMIDIDGLSGISPAFFSNISPSVKQLCLANAFAYTNQEMENGTIDHSWKALELGQSVGDVGNFARLAQDRNATSLSRRLDQLELVDSVQYERVLRALRAVFDISHLREIAVRTTNLGMVAGALRDSLVSVEIFTWHFYCEYFTFPPRPEDAPVDLARCTSLRILRLAFDHSCTRVFYPFILHTLGKIIVAGLPSTLEEITLHIEVSPRSDTPFVCMLDNEFWSMLDAVLTHRTGVFVTLRKVTVYLCFRKEAVWLWRMHGTRTIVNFLNKQCSELVERGLLCVYPTRRTLVSFLRETGEEIKDGLSDDDGDSDDGDGDGDEVEDEDDDGSEEDDNTDKDDENSKGGIEEEDEGDEDEDEG